METNDSIFISGNFTDTKYDILLLEYLFKQCGVDIWLKRDNSDPPSGELIDNCKYFISVMGTKEGAVKTPTGQTLPQLELNYAILNRKPVICIMSCPNVKSRSKLQESLRLHLKVKLGDKILGYEDINELPNIVNKLIKDGVENYSKVLKPNKVFVSHSTNDKPVVEKIVAYLNDSGYDTFYDKQDINVGNTIKNSIKKAIREVGYVVICLSNNSLGSKWVNDEIEWAVNHANEIGSEYQNFVLPIKIADFDINQNHNYLKELKFADITNNFDEGMSELVMALE